MCLNPIRIINPKSKVRIDGGENYVITIECGKCAECVYLKRKEARMRSYYQFKWTLENGGCIYFDSLTYDPKNLPRISDWIPEVKGTKLDSSCFRRKDITDYIKRVRMHMTRKGLDVKDKLKYFVVSEYGSDKKYISDSGRIRKGTKRPHYHILWFWQGDWKDIVEASNEMWGKGRTDIGNMKKHVFKIGYHEDFEHMMSVCTYVAKYVVKDLDYIKKVNKLLEKIEKKYNVDYETLEKVRKETELFKRWSNGYGISGLVYNEGEDLNNMRIKIPDKEKIWDYLKIPTYYRRKIHYKLVKNNGKYQWVLREEMKDTYIEREYESTRLYYRRTKDIVENLEMYVKEEDTFDNEKLRGIGLKLKIKEMKKKINELLDGRTIWEFAEYQTRYKGRLTKSPTDDMIERKYEILDNEECEDKDIATSFAHKTYKSLPYKFIAIGQDIKNEIDEKIKNGEKITRESIIEDYGIEEVYDIDTYASLYTINENNEKYRNFDQLEKYISYCLSEHNKRSQKTEDEKEKIKKRLKER